MNLPGTPPREAVVRPDPGLARGLWEAPAWAFYLAAATVLLGGILWLATMLRGRKSSRKAVR